VIRKVLEACPTCGGALEITEVRCTRCETEVRARYRPCDFCVLTQEQSTFLRLFVECRGNLSEVEKRLGISYPTVRAKLDELLLVLQAARPTAQAAPHAGAGRPAPAAPASPAAAPAGASPPAAAREARRGILEALARGEVGPDEAARRLHRLSQGEPTAGDSGG